LRVKLLLLYNTPVANPMATIIKNTAMIVLMVGMVIVWIYRWAVNVPRIAGIRIPAITNGCSTQIVAASIVP
jgi:hypothetical protein